MGNIVFSCGIEGFCFAKVTIVLVQSSEKNGGKETRRRVERLASFLLWGEGRKRAYGAAKGGIGTISGLLSTVKRVLMSIFANDCLITFHNQLLQYFSLSYEKNSLTWLTDADDVGGHTCSEL